MKSDDLTNISFLQAGRREIFLGRAIRTANGTKVADKDVYMRFSVCSKAFYIYRVSWQTP